MYQSVFELPTAVLNSLNEEDATKWMTVYNECDPKTDEDVKKAKKEAWRACKDLPSSFSFEIVASTDTIDKAKDIIDLDTVKSHLDSFIDHGGNIQNDHHNYQVGVIWDWKPARNEDGIEAVVAYGNLFGGDLVYDNMRKAFINGMNNLSIAGEAGESKYQCDKRGCYTRRMVEQLLEISICDNPMNSLCTLQWYNDKASLTKSASVLSLPVEQYTIHKDETTCPVLSLRKSLRDIGYDAHAKEDGVHIKMTPDEYARTYHQFIKHDISSTYKDNEVILNWTTPFTKTVYNYAETDAGLDEDRSYSNILHPQSDEDTALNDEFYSNNSCWGNLVDNLSAGYDAMFGVATNASINPKVRERHDEGQDGKSEYNLKAMRSLGNRWLKRNIRDHIKTSLRNAYNNFGDSAEHYRSFIEPVFGDRDNYWSSYHSGDRSESGGKMWYDEEGESPHFYEFDTEIAPIRKLKGPEHEAGGGDYIDPYHETAHTGYNIAMLNPEFAKRFGVNNFIEAYKKDMALLKEVGFDPKTFFHTTDLSLRDGAGPILDMLFNMTVMTGGDHTKFYIPIKDRHAKEGDMFLYRSPFNSTKLIQHVDGFNFRPGHNSTVYYKNEDSSPSEFIAQFTQLHHTKDRRALDLMRKLAPNTTKLYYDMLKYAHDMRQVKKSDFKRSLESAFKKSYSSGICDEQGILNRDISIYDFERYLGQGLIEPIPIGGYRFKKN